MKKELILHIGGNKTGSSAIQGFLSKNSATLLNQGYLVPSSDFSPDGKVSGQHVWYMKSCLHSEDGQSKIYDDLMRLVKHHSNCKGVIISAENLCDNPKAPALFEKLMVHFNIKVFCYIRRQDQYLESAWQQWYSKINTNIEPWLYQKIGLLANWSGSIKRWEEVVGRKHTNISIYERSKLLNQDVVQDFAHITGLADHIEGLSYNSEDHNISYANYITDLVAGNSSIFEDIHDNNFYKYLIDNLDLKLRKEKTDSLFSFEQRVAILKRYQSGNNWLLKNYFPKKKRLFNDIDPLSSNVEDDICKIKKQLRLLTELVYNSSKK